MPSVSRPLKPAPTGGVPTPGVDAGRSNPQRWSSQGADVFGLGTLLTLRDVELDLLALGEFPVAATGDSGVVDEDVRTATVLGDEPEPLLRVEPLHGASWHATT